jgi:hypothetical protein
LSQHLLAPDDWQPAQLETPWPNLRLYAQLQDEVDPEDTSESSLFRGEEAFEPGQTPQQQWSKPSPEPSLSEDFEPILPDSIERHAPLMVAMAREVARQIASCEQQAPVLVAILRAGVPVAALLAPLLEQHFGAPIPIVAISLFQGLGWDEAALRAVIRDYPNRPLWFVDGWTSAGGVSGELSASFERWMAKGLPDFTREHTSQVLGDSCGPRLAVLCDPRVKASASAVRADVWVPSCAFTAPRTLGFSRGFWAGEAQMFGVYTFPQRLLRPTWVRQWLQVLEAAPSPLPPDEDAGEMPPREWRVHVNEVMRALINRSPRQVLLRDEEDLARQNLRPLLHLCVSRGVPVEFGRSDLARWNTLAAARMSA